MLLASVVHITPLFLLCPPSYLRVFMCAHLYVHMCACGGQRSFSGSFLRMPSTLVFELESLSFTRSSPTGWPASEHQGLPVSTFSSLGFCPITPRLFLGGLSTFTDNHYLQPFLSCCGTGVTQKSYPVCKLSREAPAEALSPRQCLLLEMALAPVSPHCRDCRTLTDRLQPPWLPTAARGSAH